MVKFGIREVAVILGAFFLIHSELYAQCPVEPAFDSEQYCDSLVVTNTSLVPSGSIEKIYWHFGEGDTVKILTPPFDLDETHIFSSTGTYVVSLLVFNTLGCDTIVTEVIDYFYPVSNFEAEGNCNHEIISFTDKSQATIGSLVSWLWDFGDGGTSVQQHPEHVYADNGLYNVELVVTNDCGCTDTYTQSHLIENPIAGFCYDTVCFGDATPLYDTSVYTSFPITEWHWDFGDGNTATGQNQTYVFSTPGLNQVELKVINSQDCADSVLMPVWVGVPPEADFSVMPGCPKDTTFFFDESVHYADSIVNWEWDFGDLTPVSNAQNPKHVYTAGGIYSITLSVTDNFGCSDDTVKSTLLEVPYAGFTFDTVCLGTPTTFTDTSVYNPLFMITEWNWSFGDGGTSQVSDPIYEYASHGEFDAQLVVTNIMGCSDSVTQTILVDTLPIASFQVDVACAGQQTCFYDNSSAQTDTIVSWSWDFGDGSSSFLRDPCHIYAATGPFIVTLEVTNSDGCTSLPVTDTIYVSYAPEADFENSSGCFGDTLYFTNLTDTLGYEIESWWWDFGDLLSPNNNSDLMHPNHLFTAPGDYLVKLKAVNFYGCSDSIVKTITVDSIPEAFFEIPDTIAAGVEFTIIDLSVSHGSPILFKLWDFGDGTNAANINPVIHTYDTPGVYTICYTTEDLNGCVDTFCDSIAVTEIPVADFDYASDTSFQTSFYDESTPDFRLINWFWDFGDLSTTTDTVSGISDPVYTYPEEGFYEVCLKVTDRFGGEHDTCKMIYVGNAVIPNFAEYQVCLGDSTIFVDSSYSPLSAGLEVWYWDFGDGQELTYYEPIDSVKHYYNSPGIYTVKLGVSATISGYFMTDTLFKEVQVFEPPYARIDSTNLGVCFGTEMEFIDISATSIYDPVVEWMWDMDNGDFLYQKYPVYTYSDTGAYNVKLHILTEHGCTDVDSVNAYVSFAPTFTFNVENACVNSPAVFIPDYDSTKLKIISWEWNFGDHLDTLNTSTEQMPTHIYNQVDNYHVTMNMSALGCDGKSERSILVRPIPYSNFSIMPDYGGVQGRTQFTNQSIYAHTYLWDFGNGNTSTVNNPIEVYEQDSTYNVTLISYNEYGCSDTSNYQLNIFFKGLYFPTAFSPNIPNDAISRFEPKGVNLKEYLVQVFDLRGNLLWESDLLDEYGTPVESWDGYYDGRLMPNGMYIWKASGVFRDGTTWKGQAFEEDVFPQTKGTLTLIR